MEVITSVRNLVEFILRSGDIDNRKAASPENAMQEGGRIHRMLQKRMGADYHAEVTLKYTHHTERYDIIVEGRADGIIDGKLAERILREVPVCFDNRISTIERAIAVGQLRPATQEPERRHRGRQEYRKKWNCRRNSILTVWVTQLSSMRSKGLTWMSAG